MKKIALLITVILTLALSAYSSLSKNQSEPEVIKVGYIINGQPTTYQNNDGNPEGLEIEVLNLVDEALEDYTFKYEAGEQEAVLLGVDSDKYQVGLGNFFQTAARQEKYVFPEEPVGRSLISLIVRKEFEGTVNNLEDVSEKGFQFVSLPATNANYALLQNWNEDFPDKAVKIESASEWNGSEAVKWVAEGKFDVFLGPISYYRKAITELKLEDKVVVNDPFAYVNSYAIFNKDYEKLATEYSAAVKKIREDGKLDELAKKYYGSDDVYHYFDDKPEAKKYRWN
ncbi:MAG: transporter substrate-binding domain-containing protein [Flexilinea sp.]